MTAQSDGTKQLMAKTAKPSRHVCLADMYRIDYSPDRLGEKSTFHQQQTRPSRAT
jgi:hypothetical protein